MMSKKKKVSKAALNASKKAFKAELTKHVKAAKVKTKKVEITEHTDLAGPRGNRNYSYGRPGGEVWSAGYARPFTAKRGALRDEKIKKFIAKGGRIEFVKNY